MKQEFSASDIILIVLCLFMPPLAAFLKVGVKGHFWLNLFLTVFGLWVAGCIHAMWLVVREDSIA